MEQAIKISETYNGDSKEWIKPPTQKDENGNVDNEANGKVSKEFFMTYLGPYFKYTEIIDGVNNKDEDGNKTGGGSQTQVYLADGSWFRFNNGSCMDLIYDTNGDAKPNIAGKDKFIFYLCFTDYTRQAICGNKNKALCTARQNYKTRNELINACKTNTYYCSGLLEYDSWEFKNDYPYRL